MVSPKHVCVIGAGVSGLAAAKAFAARGHRVTIVERSGDLGGVWEPARSYPEVQTQSPKDLYRYTDKRDAGLLSGMAEGAAGPRLSRRLREELSVSTACCASTRRSPAWRGAPTAGRAGRSSCRGNGRQRPRTRISISSRCAPGSSTSRQTLQSVPARTAFKAQGGQILHSSKYNDPTLAKGRSVVVLGGSKSATDIAVNAVKSGAREVTIVYREPVWRIPYFIGGLVNFKRILYIRAQEEMFRAGASARCRDSRTRVAKPLIWANWRGLESLLKVQLKLDKCDMVPKERIEDGVNCSVPIATPGFYPMVADGRIKAIRGSFDHYDGNTIVMSGGAAHRRRHRRARDRLQARRALPAGRLSGTSWSMRTGNTGSTA